MLVLRIFEHGLRILLGGDSTEGGGGEGRVTARGRGHF